MTFAAFDVSVIKHSLFQTEITVNAVDCGPEEWILFPQALGSTPGQISRGVQRSTSHVHSILLIAKTIKYARIAFLSRFSTTITRLGWKPSTRSINSKQVAAHDHWITHRLKFKQSTSTDNDYVWLTHRCLVTWCITRVSPFIQFTNTIVPPIAVETSSRVSADRSVPSYGAPGYFFSPLPRESDNACSVGFSSIYFVHTVIRLHTRGEISHGDGKNCHSLWISADARAPKEGT